MSLDASRKTSRRRFLSGLGGLALAPTVTGCGWLAKQPISIASHVWVGYEPMFLARSEGWLDTRQVRLVETPSATESLQALAEGKVDGAALTLDEMFKARENGTPLSVVMVFDISAGADMLLARSRLARLADLKGLRIALEQSSVGALLLAEILEKAGLTREDVRLVPLSVDRHLEAWQHDEADVFITYEPVASHLLAQGAHKLFDSRQIPDTIVDVLAIRSDMLDRTHASAVRHLIATHFRALDHLTRNPQDAAYRMARRLNLHAAEVLPAFKGLLLPDATNNRRLLTGTSPPLLATARKLSSIMTRNGLLKHEDTLNSLIHAEFLPVDTTTSQQ